METKKQKIARLEAEVKMLREVIDNYRAIDRAMPEGCKKGAWCEKCAFHDTITNHTPDVFGFFNPVKLDICGKGRCKNFEPKEVPNADKSDS